MSRTAKKPARTAPDAAAIAEAAARLFEWD